MAMTRRAVIAGWRVRRVAAVAVRRAVRTRPPQATAGRRRSCGRVVRDVRQLPGVPQRPDDADGEDVSIGVVLARVDDGELVARSRTGRRRSGARRWTIRRTRDAIEDECAICHMPMARAAAHAAGGARTVFALAAVGARRHSDEHQLAADGVSCTLCHQIGPDGLGTRESFVGGFVIAPRPQTAVPDVRPVRGRRRACTAMMRSATGVAAGEGGAPPAVGAVRHLPHALHAGARPNGRGRSARCPSRCRTSSGGTARSSRASASLPVVPHAGGRADDTPIASVLGEPREQLARHTFLGGNFFMLRMLNRFRGDARRHGARPELEAAAQATLRQLRPTPRASRSREPRWPTAGSTPTSSSAI